jgi:uncharacterized protein (TIGR02594 family)
MKELLLEALKHYGIREVAGPESNPLILKIFSDIGYSWVKDDSTTAWCSAAMNYFCKKLGYERSGKLTARSWLNVGDAVTEPELGDVIVLWRVRRDSWEGHVGFYIAEDDEFYFILGGNQDNSFNITPYLKTRLLGFRRLSKEKP